MPKQSGLGDNFFVGAYDLSGFTQALGNVGGGNTPIDVTDVSQSAFSRLGGVRDGRMEWTSYFAPDTGEAHPVLSALPRTDIVASYLRGTGIGSPAACIVAKQINYDANRNQDGSLTFAVQAMANRYGLEWGEQLTDGLRTDTAATEGDSLDTAASASFGWSAFLHVTAFSGTDVTVKIEDSADDSSWADLSGAAFTQITAVGSERIMAASTTATVRRYVRATTTTSGGVTSVSFVVVLCKHYDSEVIY